MTRSARGGGRMDPELYKQELRALQIELVKFQREVIGKDRRVLVIVEGRDAAGKDGLIKRVTAHMAPRETRIVALPKPSDRDRTLWYFQRYVAHLPAAGEFVLFNRSWYNRAGVERVMGFCNDDEYQAFMATVTAFEAMLADSGIMLFKYYLDICRDEQKQRLKERQADPLSHWKVSPIDASALKLWKDYSKARDAMLARTHHPAGPWTVVRADDKRASRVNMLRDLLSRASYAGKDEALVKPDRAIVFPYEAAAHEQGLIAP
ncbi:MAG: polyphosphate kinase 2 [Alphaproteobacteria bacterium]